MSPVSPEKLARSAGRAGCGEAAAVAFRGSALDDVLARSDGT